MLYNICMSTAVHNIRVSKFSSSDPWDDWFESERAPQLTETKKDPDEDES